MSVIVSLFLVPAIAFLLIALNLLFSVHRPDAEKVSPYECGFNPLYGQVRTPFTIQYYLVGILFLVFDIEIAILYPLAVTLGQVATFGYWVSFFLVLLLTIGFCFEVNIGVLKFTDNRSALTAPVPMDSLTHI